MRTKADNEQQRVYSRRMAARRPALSLQLETIEIHSDLNSWELIWQSHITGRTSLGLWAIVPGCRYFSCWFWGPKASPLLSADPYTARREYKEPRVRPAATPPCCFESFSPRDNHIPTYPGPDLILTTHPIIRARRVRSLGRRKSYCFWIYIRQSFRKGNHQYSSDVEWWKVLVPRLHWAAPWTCCSRATAAEKGEEGWLISRRYFLCSVIAKTIMEEWWPRRRMISTTVTNFVTLCLRRALDRWAVSDEWRVGVRVLMVASASFFVAGHTSNGTKQCNF